MNLPIAKSSNALAPEAISRPVADLLTHMVNALEGRGIAGEVIAHRAAPTPEQRRWLEGRSDELAGALLPADERSRRAELASLFAVLAIEGADAKEARAVAEIYLTDVADIPLFALRAACQEARRGGRFVPKIAELRASALRAAQPWRDEHAKITRILGARVLAAPGDERRQKAIAHVEETKRLLAAAAQVVDARDLRGSFKAAPAPIEPEGPPLSKAEQALKRLDELRALPIPELSSSLRSSLNLPEKDEAA